MKALVKADNVGKNFIHRSDARRWRDLAAGAWRRSAREPLWALRGVSFEVAAGEMLGIVGANGAGKSTLLRLLGGIGRPSTGSVEIHGRIGALLELGGGFQGDLTGRENAILAAVVAGLLKREAIERLPEIIRFAELEDFIDVPVRTYSTGMTMRLAFAVAVHTDPEILLVDEYLAVGDLAFQAKCAGRIAELRGRGCAIVLVSHGMDQVRELCDRALWLRHGEVMACDSAQAVAAAYEQEMREETLRRTPAAPARTMGAGTELRPRENRFGSLEMEITGVFLRPGPALTTGGTLGIEIGYHAENPLPAPVFAVSISRPDGTVCLDTNTLSARVAVAQVKGSGTIRLAIERLDLGAGSYFVDVGVFESNWSHAYDYHWHVYQLTVAGGSGHKGILAPPCRWSLAEKHSPEVSAPLTLPALVRSA
jgi:lipopolysaccharide transport system ATP-binding protein